MAVPLTYIPHSTSIDNEANISSGWSDSPLSETGIRQAQDLGILLKTKKFDAVFCSDLRRSVETARLAFSNIPIITDERLRECNYGTLNGKPSSVVEPLIRKNITDKFPDGESCEDVKIRMNDFLYSLRSNYNNTSIAIISHKVPQLALEVLLNNKKWGDVIAGDWRKTKSWQPGWEYSYLL